MKQETFHAIVAVAFRDGLLFGRPTWNKAEPVVVNKAADYADMITKMYADQLEPNE